MIQLASKSPRRHEILCQIGVPHRVLAVDVPEVMASEEAPSDYVCRLARTKAEVGFARAPGLPTLGADTVVCCDGRVLEKPVDQADGRAMLSLLSNRTHTVLTGLALVRSNAQVLIDYAVTEVAFAPVSEQQIQAYWATGEPCDKAGGYGIQGFGAVFVKAIHGSYTNVVGLPVEVLSHMLTHCDLPCWVA